MPGGANCEIAQVVEGPIPFFALCEHHALPFFGNVWVGYVAHEGIIGISKLTRLVRVVTRRFGVQERMTYQICDELDRMMAPHGVAVYAEAQHLCTQMRGVRELHPKTRTTSYRGVYVDSPQLRGEFYDVSGLRAAAAPDDREDRHDGGAPTTRRDRRPIRRARLDTLWEAPAGRTGSAQRGGAFPAGLLARYDGELRVPLRRDRPAVIANFVSTLDGVVAFDTEGASGGGEISGFFEPDRFVMGLLRAMADVVLVGAGTVRAAPTHEWTARHVQRASADTFALWRRRLGITTAQPTTVVVTASGSLDLSHPGLSAPDVPVVIVTTDAGARRLRPVGPGSNVRIEVAGRGRSVDARRVLEIASADGARLILCEGGPHLIGDLVERDLLDELFVTLAPQLAGRDPDVGRLALVEGVAFEPATAPWSRLVSVRRSGDHLFLRHRLRHGPRPS